MTDTAAPITPARDGCSWGGWTIGLLILALHGLLTLRLFGANYGETWSALTDDRPVTAGRHALHLYHGTLGARALREDARAVCYDPNFGAGYPKTPWFDGGNKPAEISMLIGGRKNQTAAYKVGLAVCWWLLPWLAGLAATACGMSAAVRSGTMLLTVLLCWSDAGRERLWAGDTAHLLASVGLLVAAAALAGYHATPGPRSWVAFTLAVAGVVFVQPLFLGVLLPAALLFYLRVGWQRSLAWHGWLALGWMLALGVNLPWILALMRTWWILCDLPAPAAGSVSAGRDWWLWADAVPLGAAGLLLLAGLVGLVALRRGPYASAARMLTAAAAGAATVGLFGPSWEPREMVESAPWLVTVLFLATLPASYLGAICWQWLSLQQGGTLVQRAMAAAIVLMAGLIVFHAPSRANLLPLPDVSSLPLGLTTDQDLLATAVRAHTAPTARILWEETRGDATWTALLPVLTGRSYLGGLGAGAFLEHLHARLVDATLAGNSLHDAPDAALRPFVTLYNVGWIVARTPATTTALRAATIVTPTAELPGGATLFTVRQPSGFFARGQGRIVSCDSYRITLADLVPDEGQVVIRFHHHPHMIPSSDRVVIDKADQVDDPIPFIRLHLSGPTARVTITWQD